MNVPTRSRAALCSLVQISWSVSALNARRMPPARTSFASLVGIEAHTMPLFAADALAEIVSDPPGWPGDRTTPCLYGDVSFPSIS
jgi:hypothetical protein